MLEYGFAFLAVLAAWLVRPDGLSRSLFLAWALSVVSAIVLPKPFMPGAFAVIDGALALVGLWAWTHGNCQRGRIIGLISMVLICAHFGYSSAGGSGSWLLYASIVNAGFALQCFTAGGGWYGVARFFNRFWRRHPHLHISLHKRR